MPLASHLPLCILRLTVPLLLARLPVGGVAAIEAAGGGAKHAVMTGEMSGSASEDGALDAALRVGGGSGRESQCGDSECSKYSSHDQSPCEGLSPQRQRRAQVPDQRRTMRPRPKRPACPDGRPPLFR